MNTQPIQNKTLYLVRHGLSTLSKRGYGRRKLTAGLLPQGAAAIEKIASYLKDTPFSYNVSSDLPRCRQTAGIITNITGKPFVYDKRLTEFYHESFTDFKARIADFLEYISTVPEEYIIICSHAAVIAGITDLTIKGSFTYKKNYDDPLEGELVVLDKGGYRKIRF